MKQYSNKSNAKRAASTLSAKLGAAFDVSVTADNTICVISTTAEVALHPTERELLADVEVIWPEAPDAANPVLPRKPMKPYSQWDFSDCETPVAVAHEVYGAYHAAGNLDDRKAAIKDAMDAGVQRNTAHTQYRRFRIMMGLPSAVGKKTK